jgi:hypothetical protein
MSETVTGYRNAANQYLAVELPLGSLDQVFTYDGTFVETITVVYGNVTFVQTFTNDGTNITNISAFREPT